MSYLMDYLVEYRDVDLKEHPFSAVDALVLCQVTYPKLDGIVPSDGFVGWDHIISHKDKDSLYTDRMFGDMYREFLENVASGKRYEKIEAGFFREHVSIENECQFAAVTFRMKPDNRFIAFRGTDEKLVGWKEDFNMGHLDVIPSQEMALDYLNRTPGEGSIYVGGHSKGGSQAIYAAAMADSSVKKHIKEVYSFDGMGLGEEFYETDEFKEIQGRFTKIIPEESIIGMLFERLEYCKIVQSDKSGFKQHDFMNWYVENGDFLYTDALKKKTVKLLHRLNSWIDSMDHKERKNCVDILYELLLSCEPEEIYDMGDDKRTKAKIVYGKYKNLEKEVREDLKKTLKKLI